MGSAAAEPIGSALVVAMFSTSLPVLAADSLTGRESLHGFFTS